MEAGAQCAIAPRPTGQQEGKKHHAALVVWICATFCNTEKTFSHLPQSRAYIPFFQFSFHYLGPYFFPPLFQLFQHLSCEN